LIPNISIIYTCWIIITLPKLTILILYFNVTLLIPKEKTAPLLIIKEKEFPTEIWEALVNEIVVGFKINNKSPKPHSPF
jgi:hypothetical protein